MKEGIENQERGGTTDQDRGGGEVRTEEGETVTKDGRVEGVLNTK